MRERLLRFAVCFVLLVGISVSLTGQVSDELSDRLLELVPSDTVSNADVFETNGFHVVSSRNRELDADLTPSGNQFEGLIVKADGVFKVGIEKGRSMSTGGGLGIYHRSSGVPMLTAADRNGDGRVDLVTYSVLNDDGETIREVIDYDADGQANIRIHFAESYSEIWHADGWHRIENQDGVRGIMFEGTFKEIRRLDGQLVVN